MIEFVTLLLGLSYGVQPVEVAVAGPVAAVVLELDGREVGRREAPPWVFACDLGAELLPRRLEAAALDAEGRELGRARQFVNYHRRNEDATIFLEAAGGEQTRGRVAWSSFRDRRPKQVEVFFDDTELPVADDGTFTLPAHDRGSPHHLLATVRFPGGEPLRRELVFGGAYGERVTSSLTAVPVLIAGERQPPAAAEMAGWLEARGEPLRVFTVEKPPEVVAVVRDRDAGKRLDRLRRELRKKRLQPPAVLGPRTETVFVRTHAVPEHPHIFQSVRASSVVESLSRSRAGRRPPGSDDDGRFGRPPASFTLEDDRRLYRELWPLVQIGVTISQKEEPQRLAEALAVAGRLASSLERPRAVLLLAGDQPEDHSRLTLGTVQRFLSALRVPAHVWAYEAKTFAALEAGGGAGLHVGAEGLVEAFRAIEASLAAQHVVWVEGDHLPNEVRLGPAAPAWLALAE